MLFEKVHYNDGLWGLYFHPNRSMLTFDTFRPKPKRVEYGRDLRLSIEEIRSNESGMTDLGGRQESTVCFQRCGRQV